MKKTFVAIVMMACASVCASAQDAVQKAAQDAVEAFASAPEQKEEPKKPNYWTNSLTTQINVGQTGLTNWAAGGDNTFTLKGYVDGSCNWAKDKMFWNNRLQLEYGVLYASSKPLFQKSNDRFYFESKWGHRIVEQLYASANFDFKSQFSTGYDYNTPNAAQISEASGGSGTELDDLTREQQTAAWKLARKAKSSLLSPAYATLALGLDWTPANWVSVSLAPLTGGYTIVADGRFRKTYGMKMTSEAKEQMNEFAGYDPEAYDPVTATEEEKEYYFAYQRYVDSINDGSAYHSALFQLGAQMKIDFKVNVNDNFKYTSQVVLFTDYLAKDDETNKYKGNIRFNWDNKIDWKLAKYFALTLTTNMIYDSTVLNPDKKDENGNPAKRGLQFAESISIGFTYTIASKSK